MSLDKSTRDGERLLPAEREVEERDEIPEAIVREMRELGLFGLTIPEAYSGLDPGCEDEALLVFELCESLPAFRSLIGTTIGIRSQGIAMFGTDEQKSTWLPRRASGELIASFCLTGPEAGSDASSLRTAAGRDGGHFILDGTTLLSGCSYLPVVRRYKPDPTTCDRETDSSSEAVAGQRLPRGVFPNE